MSATVRRDWVAIIANVGVILGLVFVGLEVKNSQDDVNASIAAGLSGWRDFNALQTDPEVATVIDKALRNPDSMTRVEGIQMSGWLWAISNQFRQYHHLHVAGLIPETEYRPELWAVGLLFTHEYPRWWLFEYPYHYSEESAGVEALRAEVIRIEREWCAKGDGRCPR